MTTDDQGIVNPPSCGQSAAPGERPNSPTFIGLPKEVRLQILKYTLNPGEGDSRKICYVWNCGLTRKQIVYDEPDGTKCPGFGTKRCPGILLANRQIYEEGREILHKITKFTFCSRVCLRLFSQSVNKDHAKLVEEITCGKTTDTLLTIPFVMIKHNQQKVDNYMMNLVVCSDEVGANLSVFIDDVQDILDTFYEKVTWNKCLLDETPNYLGYKPMRLVLQKAKEEADIQTAAVGIKYINRGAEVTTLPNPPDLDLFWAKVCFWLSTPAKGREPLDVFCDQVDHLFDFDTGESHLEPQLTGLFVVDDD